MQIFPDSLVQYGENPAVFDPVIAAVIGFDTAADPLNAGTQTGVFAKLKLMA